jgi:hypothetical protein
MAIFITIIICVAVVACWANWNDTRIRRARLDHDLHMSREETRRMEITANVAPTAADTTPAARR